MTPETLTFARAETGGDVPILSRYVERFWLPIVGPSALCAVRLLAATAIPPEGMRIPEVDFAGWLGVKRNKGHACAMRAAQFGLLRAYGEGRFEVLSHVPFLTPTQVRRLTPALQTLHGQARAKVAA